MRPVVRENRPQTWVFFKRCDLQPTRVTGTSIFDVAHLGSTLAQMARGLTAMRAKCRGICLPASVRGLGGSSGSGGSSGAGEFSSPATGSGRGYRETGGNRWSECVISVACHARQAAAVSSAAATARFWRGRARTVAACEGRITTRCIHAYPQAGQLVATHFVVCADPPRYGPFSPVGRTACS